MRRFEELLRSTVPPDRVEEVCGEAGRLRTVIALGTLCDDFRLDSSTLVVDALFRLHYAASPFRASLPIPQDAPATSKIEEDPLLQQYDPGGAKEPLFIHPSGELVRLLALRMRNWVHDQFDEYERSSLRLMDLAPSELDLFCAVGRRLQGPRLPRALGKVTELEAEQGLHEFVDAAVDLKLTVEALARGTDPDILSATGDVDQFTLRKICLAQAPSLNTGPQKTFTPDLVLFADHPPGHLEPILQGESKRSVSATAPAPPPTPLRVPRASLATSSLARSTSSTLSLALSPSSRFVPERLQNLRSATPSYRGFKIGDIEEGNGSRRLIQKLLMISDSAPALRSSLVNDTNSAFLVLHYRFAKSSTPASSRTGVVLSANQSFEDRAFLQAVVALMLPAVDEPMLFNTVFLEDVAVSVTKAYSKEGYALHPRTSHDQPSTAQSSPANQLVDSPGSAAALALDAALSASRSGVEQDERAAQGGEREQDAQGSEGEQGALRDTTAQVPHAMASGSERAAHGGMGDLLLRLRAVDAIGIRTSPTQSAACLRLCRVPFCGPYEPVYAPFRGPPPSPTEPLFLFERVNDLYGRTSFVYFATHDDPPCELALKQDSMTTLWHEAQVYHALAKRDLHHIAPACLGLFVWEDGAGAVWDEGQAPRKSGVLVTERCGSSVALLAASGETLSSEQEDTAVFLLEELHRAGFTHGDFARRNVVLDRRTGDLKLIDFAHAQPHLNCLGTELCDELRDARQSLRAS
ncbi:hypothetical protein JCM10449v2_002872 [Rhodotorula kratochvilovae]